MATYRIIGLVFVLVLATACGSADGSGPSEESSPSSSELQETVSISVADGCATLTDPGSGSELVTTCEPPLSNPLFVWGDDTAAASVNLIRVPPGTGLERTQGDSFNVSYDIIRVAENRVRTTATAGVPHAEQRIVPMRTAARSSGVSTSLTSRRMQTELGRTATRLMSGNRCPATRRACGYRRTLRRTESRQHGLTSHEISAQA